MKRHSRARGIGALVLASMLSTAMIGGNAQAGSPSLPVDLFPPRIALEHSELGPPPLTIDFTATATDDDGKIRSLEICVSDMVDGRECSSRQGTPPNVVSDLAACTEGDTLTEVVTHTFDAPGWYQIEVSAVGATCPGFAETQGTEFELIVLAPPLPPIVCAQEGVPTATDVGVEPDSVRLGAVVSETGVDGDTDFLARQAIWAAKDAVNESGGVCGRDLAIDILDDGSHHQPGRERVQELIDSGVFALVSMPGWRALQSVIEDGTLTAAGVPVIGSAGRVDAEFGHELVWPAAPPAEVFAIDAVAHAYDAGARTFAIVVNDDAVGLETADLLRDEVLSRPGTEVRFSHVARWSRDDATAAVVAMREECGPAGCDAVLLDLGLVNSVFWGLDTEEQQAQPNVETSASARAAVGSLAHVCGPACDDWLVWSGFDLPVPGAGEQAFRYAAEVARHPPLGEVSSVQASTVAAYAGVITAARAMGAVGVELTRADLGDVLDSVPIDIGLTDGPLAWSAVARDANRSMRAYVLDAGELLGLRPVDGWTPAP